MPPDSPLVGTILPGSASPAESPTSDFALRTSNFSRIRVLPPEVTSRIAAGEVIERPASVVKELVENALDAGARKIRVDLSGGGVTLVRVTDDGCGMEKDDLPLAIQPHATSKLSDAGEITELSTLGFRGEALPSIAAVSRFTLTSHAAHSLDGAWRIELAGGLPRDPAPKPAGAPKGTTVEARDLFFNLPARAKFLKGAGTEAAACTEVALRLALSRPDVGFSLYQDSHEIIALPAATEARNHKESGHAAPSLPPEAFVARARAVLGAANAKGLFELDTAADADNKEHFHGYRLFGLLSPPAVSRPNRAQIYLNINGRPVKDRTLTSALLEAYRHLLPPRRYPLAVLFLELPPGDVDINVHPTKAEVRFRSPGLVYALLHHAVRSACQGIADCGLRIADLEGAASRRSEFSLQPEAVPASPTIQRHLDLWPRAPSAPEKNEPPRRQERQEQTDGIANSAAKVEARGYTDIETPSASLAAEAAPYRPVSTPVNASAERRTGISQPPSISQSAIPRFERKDEGPQSAMDARVLGQAQASYIVIEDASGLKIVDQHALHERILFEGLMKKAREASRGDSQGLLIPEQIELTPVQAAVFLQDQNAAGTLAELGFHVEMKGARTLVIRAIPAILTSSRHKPARAVADVLDALASTSDELSERKPLSRAYYREKAAYVLSCKGAIKAGERLTLEQMQALIADFHALVGNSGFTCPHGRPLAKEVSWGEIERAVGR